MMNCQETNGRVNIIVPSPDTLFTLKDRIPVGSKTSAYRDAMEGIWYDTALSTCFFSVRNINLLQEELQQGVYKASNQQYVIDRQDDDELKIIMRAMFLTHSRNLPSDIRSQIKKLNSYVLDYAVPQVYGEAQGYAQYKIDASTMYSGGTALMERPMLSSVYGKQLELKPWF